MQRPAVSRFVILGGSFSPVHIGHVALAGALAGLPGVTETLVIPAARNPLKGGDHLLPPELRLHMLRAAFADTPKVSVLDLELVRGPPSYTFDTVTELRNAYPGTVFDIALGWDAYRDFRAWHRAEELLEVVGLLVVPRVEPGVPPSSADSPSSRALTASLPQSWQGRLAEGNPGLWLDRTGRAVVRLLPLPIPEVSATRIWAERRWDLVPERARILLLRYLERGDPTVGATGLHPSRHPG